MSYTGIFDSHAHYDDPRFDPDRDEILRLLAEQGVAAVTNIGCDRPTSVASMELSKRYPFIYATVGFHPHEARHYERSDALLMEQWCGEEKCVAVGEIGLDYHYDHSPRDVQRRVFEAQLQLARELHMPVVIHSREATEDTLELLRKYRPQGVVHCFSGSAETAGEILKLGMYIGYTGVITFPNARRVLSAVAETPLDRILLETDCPYMAPAPHRGTRCDSGMLGYVAEKIGEIKGIGAQELIDRAAENTRQLYRIR